MDNLNLMLIIKSEKELIIIQTEVHKNYINCRTLRAFLLYILIILYNRGEIIFLCRQPCEFILSTMGTCEVTNNNFP